MRAWRAHALGEPEEVLRLDELATPQPASGEVVVAVEAASLNFPDVLVCRGEYQERPPLPFTPGIEIAGKVVAAGEGADGLLGQRVMAMPTLPRGGLAEQVVIPARDALPVPDWVPSNQAAALLITYQTGYFALHRRAQIQRGETLLVHGGAGGVGSAAIQLGVAAGARVLAGGTGPEQVEVCRQLGAERAFDYLTEDFVEIVKEATKGKGADVISDPVGGDVFDRSRRCINFEGRIVVIGFASGQIADLPTNHALIKNYSVLGLHWALYRKKAPGLVAEAHEALMALYRQGLIRPLVSTELPLEEAPQGLTMLAQGRSLGKVVVQSKS
jgi:NADPH2:quinone reductase